MAGSNWKASYFGHDAGGRYASSSMRLAQKPTPIPTTPASGNLISQTGSTENVYLYRGEQFDPGLGMN